MSAQLDLFSWIKAQEQAGDVESTGVFTIEKSRAWEKLGAFALPFEHAWLLKVAQAAVSAGSGLNIEQGRTETVCRWSTGPGWSHSHLEAAMLDPEPDKDRALEHLAVGLRALAKATELPFAIDYADGTRAIWTGNGFQLGSGAPDGPPAFSLTVSHFKVGESSFFLSLDNLDASKRASAMASVLANRAHWAPTAISVDGRSVANVFNDPQFGSSSLRQPLYLLLAPADPAIPSLRVQAQFFPPDTTFSGAPDISAVESQIAQAVTAVEKPCLAVAMISAFISKRRVGKSYVFDPLPQRSQLVWVNDGVEVAREELPLAPSPAAVLVACSSAGLDTDLSGLVPRETSAKAQRREAVLRAMSAQVAITSLDAEVAGSNIVSFGIMLVGGLVMMANPPIGFVALAAGGMSLAFDNARQSSLEEAVDKGLADLRDQLEQKWGRRTKLMG